MTIEMTGITADLDESDGLQLNDTDGLQLNDIGVMSPFGTLFGTPIEVALSGYDADDDPDAFPTGQTIFSTDDGLSASTFALAADGTGTRFPTDPEGAFTPGATSVDSGLKTTDGQTIYLFATDDPLMVVGRTADGTVVLAVSLELVTDPDGNVTGGKLWTALYEPLKHAAADGGDPDGPLLTLENKIYVSASSETTFDAAGVPSGQNLFIMFKGIENPDLGIVVTGKAPANQSDGANINAGDTVNTSQVTGTTFGVNNQMIDAKEGLWFTFVTNPANDYTVPNLSQTEADVEGNIQFGGSFSASSVEFDVVQLQGGKSAVVKITAIDSPDVGNGTTFIDELLSDNGNADLIVDITTVTVTLAGGGSVTFTQGGSVSGITATFNADGSVQLAGLKAGDSIEYTTDGGHDRVLIENDGSGKGQASAAFDIGGFTITDTTDLNLEIGSKARFADDEPTVAIGDGDGVDPAASSSVEEGDTVGGSIAVDGGADGVKTVSVAISGDPAGATKTIALTDGQSITFDDPDGVKGTLTVSYSTADGLTWSFDADPDTSGSASGGGSFSFSVTVTDGDDDTDNDTHTVIVNDSSPLLSISSVAVDEDGIVTGAERPGVGDDAIGNADGDNNEATATGTISVTDDDTPVTLQIAFSGAKAGGDPLTLKSGGATVNTVTVGSTLYFYTGTAPAQDEAPATGAIVATLSWTGTSYAYAQIRPFDHPDTDDPDTGATETAHEDNIILSFNGTATDSLGNTQSASFTVNVDDDSPELTVGNMAGSGTTDPQVGQWAGASGADAPGSLKVWMNSYTIGDTTTTLPEPVALTETAPGSGVFTGEINEVDFTLTFYSDGSYEFTLSEGFGSTATFSTADGSLPAGGPDPVQTLMIPSSLQPDGFDSVVFFAVNPAATGGDITSVLGLTEAQIEGGTYSFIGSSWLMNVSTSGIGVGNNVLEGNRTANGPAAFAAADESFVVNPETAVSSMTVYIDNSVGGYAASADSAITGKEEALYYRIFYADGSVSGWTLVTQGMLEPAGQMVSFDIDGGGTLINAVQFTMDKGAIKIPVIEFTVATESIADPVAIDFTAALTDADGDTVTADFTVSLNADPNPLAAPGIELTGVMGEQDSFNIDLPMPMESWVINGFDRTEDDLLVVSASDFGGGLATGVLGADYFVWGTVAADADDRFLYDTGTGELRFDADGNGAGEAVLVATLTDAPELMAEDILVIA